MSAPTLEQTRAAASGIHSMANEDFARRKREEAGDALTAFFVILARKLFPKDVEEAIATRVETMLAAYFLRGEVEGSKGKAPSDPAAKKAVDHVSSLTGAQLDQRITDEIGEAMLAFFSAFSKKVLPHETEPMRKAMQVQLMVLAYLARKHVMVS